MSDRNPQVEIQHLIPFHDVDMLEVAWHGHYYKYFELARTALFNKYDFDVPKIKALGYAMVIVDSRCRYLKPLTYGMTVRIQARLIELAFRIKIVYRILDGETGALLSKGETTQVTLNPQNGEMYYNTPDPIIERFGNPPLAETHTQGSAG